MEVVRKSIDESGMHVISIRVEDGHIETLFFKDKVSDKEAISTLIRMTENMAEANKIEEQIAKDKAYAEERRKRDEAEYKKYNPQIDEPTK